jgi:antitoxin ParD1/3/4
MNISLPDSLKSFVDEQVAKRGYGTSSEYVRELIRGDQDRQRLRDLLLDGAASPAAANADEAYFGGLRNRVRRAEVKRTEAGRPAELVRAAPPRSLFSSRPPCAEDGASAVEALIEERREGRRRFGTPRRSCRFWPMRGQPDACKPSPSAIPKCWCSPQRAVRRDVAGIHPDRRRRSDARRRT